METSFPHSLTIKFSLSFVHSWLKNVYRFNADEYLWLLFTLSLALKHTTWTNNNPGKWRRNCGNRKVTTASKPANG